MSLRNYVDLERFSDGFRHPFSCISMGPFPNDRPLTFTATFLLAHAMARAKLRVERMSQTVASDFRCELEVFVAKNHRIRGFQLDGSVVRQARRQRGLSQEALAHLASCDVKTIRNAELERRIDRSTGIRIATALERPVGAILLPVRREPNHGPDNIRIFWAWYKSMSSCNLEQVMVLYHKSALVHAPGFHDLPGGADARGWQAIRKHLQARLEAFEFRVTKRETFRVSAFDENVFARGAVSIAVRGTRGRISTIMYHEMQFQAGTILKHVAVMDTAPLREMWYRRGQAV